MEYLCLACGHRWDRDPTATYLQCPEPSCRSRDVVPGSFWSMVETARELGISDNTPILDHRNAFYAVLEQEGILSLGVGESWRVIKRIIRQVENPGFRRQKVHVE